MEESQSIDDLHGVLITETARLRELAEFETDHEMLASVERRAHAILAAVRALRLRLAVH